SCARGDALDGVCARLAAADIPSVWYVDRRRPRWKPRRYRGGDPRDDGDPARAHPTRARDGGQSCRPDLVGGRTDDPGVQGIATERVKGFIRAAPRIPAGDRGPDPRDKDSWADWRLPRPGGTDRRPSHAARFAGICGCLAARPRRGSASPVAGRDVWLAS